MHTTRSILAAGTLVLGLLLVGCETVDDGYDRRYPRGQNDGYGHDGYGHDDGYGHRGHRDRPGPYYPDHRNDRRNDRWDNDDDSRQGGHWDDDDDGSWRDDRGGHNDRGGWDDDDDDWRQGDWDNDDDDGGRDDRWNRDRRDRDRRDRDDRSGRDRDRRDNRNQPGWNRPGPQGPQGGPVQPPVRYPSVISGTVSSGVSVRVQRGGRILVELVDGQTGSVVSTSVLTDTALPSPFQLRVPHSLQGGRRYTARARLVSGVGGANTVMASGNIPVMSGGGRSSNIQLVLSR